MKTYYPLVIENAENLARLVTITRETEVVRFTDHHDDITIDGETWTAEPGAVMSSMEFSTDGAVSNAVVQMSKRDGGPISDVDMAIGRYDGYPMTIHCVDTGNLTLPAGLMFTGYVGAIKTQIAGSIQIAARGPLTKMRQDISEKYSVMCRADLGDARCKIPIMPDDIARNTLYVAGDPIASMVRVRATNTSSPADYQNLYFEVTQGGTTAGSQPDYTGLVDGDTITDGSAILTARNAYTRAAVIATVETPQSFTITELPDVRAVDGYYDLGNIIIRSGRYDGNMVPIRGWFADELIVRTWFLVSHMIEPGTKIEIIPGCAKTEAACNTFTASFAPAPQGNIVNRRAETFAPGADALLAQA